MPSPLTRMTSCFRLFVFGSVLFFSSIATAQDFLIDTIAGDNAGFSGDEGFGSNANFSSPLDVVFDQNGNLYIVDTDNNRIRRIDTNGIINTVAGTGTAGFGGDGGPAVNAVLNEPKGIIIDLSGNIYVADSGNHVIRQIDINGTISTIAGQPGVAGFGGDSGAAINAQLNLPIGLALDSISSDLYIADSQNHRIRKVDLSRATITTVAGNGSAGFSGDGDLATAAALNVPADVLLDAFDNIFIADTGNHRIRGVDTAGNIITIAGNGIAGGDGNDGLVTSAQLNSPRALSFGSNNTLYLTDDADHTVRVIDLSSGVISSIAGISNSEGFSGDNGLATLAQLRSPSGIAFRDEVLYIADTGNQRIRAVGSTVTKLVITAQIPPPAGEALAGTTDILVRFDEALDPGSVNETSFAVHGSLSGRLDILTTPIVTQNEIRLPASSFLEAGETVTITATQLIASTLGHTLEQPIQWQFRVEPRLGIGVFSLSNSIADANNSQDIVLGDFNDDDSLDAIIATASEGNIILLNDGTGNFTANGQILGNADTKGVSIGDLDNDGDLDVFLANDGANTVFLNNGAAIFTNSGQNLGSAASAAVALGDLDKDGDLDAFIANDTSPNSVWLNTNGTFSLGQSLGGNNPSTDVALSDFDNDGNLDAFVTNSSGNADEVWLNDGSAFFSNNGQTLNTADSRAVALGDVNDDGIPDVVIANFNQPNALLRGNGNGSFSQVNNNFSDLASLGVNLNDVDSDGDLDAFFVNSGEASTVWFNNAGVFSNSGQTLLSANSQDVAIGDLDQDDDLDAFVINRGEADSILLNGAASELFVTSLTPSRHSHDLQPSNSLVSIGFSDDIASSTVSEASVIVHGSLSGHINGSYDVNDNFVNFIPENLFKPNELMTVSLTRTLQGLSGSRLVSNSVFQFRVGATGSDNDFSHINEIPGTESMRIIAAGYLDDDENIDIIAVLGEQPAEILTNQGGGEFVASGRLIGSANIKSIALGDLDLDGDLDAFVTTRLNDDEVWLNIGGNFTQTQTLTDAVNSTGVALADLDGDGDLDAIVGRDSTADQENVIYLNNGAANFTLGQPALAFGNTQDIALGDIDNDNDLDLIAANFAQADQIFLNDGHNARFTDSGIVNELRSSQVLQTGDLNNDGALDILIGFSAGQILYQRNDSSVPGTNFRDEFLPTGSTNTQDIEVGDINGDGFLDVVLALSDDHLTVLLNDTSGNFDIIFQSTDIGYDGVSLVDLDRDNDLDLVASPLSGNIQVFLNSGTDLFELLNVFPPPNTQISSTSDNINLAFTQPLSSTIDNGLVLASRLSGKLIPVPAIASGMTLAISPPTGGFIPGDTLNLILTDELLSDSGTALFNPALFEFFIRPTDGVGTFAESIAFGDSESFTAYLHDLDNDGDLDAIFANNGPNTVWLNDGTGDFGASPAQSLGNTFSIGVAVGDINGDGLADLGFAEDGPNTFWLGDGEGGFAQTSFTLGNAGSRSMMFSDLNNDGALDIVIANDGPNSVWLNDGSGNFDGPPVAVLGNSHSIGVATGDFNNDKFLDIYFSNLGPDSVWLNDGHGDFVDPPSAILGNAESFGVALHDLNEDGAIDAFVVNGSGANSVWLNDGSAQFNEFPLPVTIPGFGVALGDVENDGDIDAIVTGSANQVWLNDGNANFAQGQVFGNKVGIIPAIGDINGDGALDILAANFGPNQVWLNDGQSLNVSITGLGNVIASPGLGNGIDCQPLCQDAYATGETVELLATPLPGAFFDGWRGDCNGADSIFALIISGPSTCIADFILPTVESIAGTGSIGLTGDGGLATEAMLAFPAGMTLDADGNLYFADSGNHAIRRISSDGLITTIAGTGEPGFGGDGENAATALLNSPLDVAIDTNGNLYIADFRNHRIRRIDTNGIISTIAGDGQEGFSGDNGSATTARLSFPTGLAIHESGLIFVADSGNHRVRVITTDGMIFTLAGDGTPGFSGDGGSAVAARLNRPWGLTVTATDLYIADSFNHRVRKINIDGSIQTVAGNGTRGFSGDNGVALTAQLNEPRDIALDGTGNLYIVDTQNQRIRIVNTNGLIGTLGGTGVAEFSGDGNNANAAGFAAPLGIVTNGNNEVSIADTANQRIRMIKP